MTYKSGDLLPNGEIYLCRLDDEIFTVAQMAPKKMSWDDAMEYAANLGLELPDLDITQIMFKRKDIGAFKDSYDPASNLWSARRYSGSTRTTSGSTSAPRATTTGRTSWWFVLSGELII